MTRQRSPRRKGYFSPKNSNLELGQADSSSTHGYFSTFGSIIGHDDPTAVMGNVVPGEISSHTGMSVGTIASFVTTEHDRDPYGSGDGHDPLRDQLNELDQAANGWRENNHDNTSTVMMGSDVEEFYVNEAGTMKASRGGYRGHPKMLPHTIEESGERSTNEEHDGVDEEEARDVLMPISHNLDLRLQESREDSRASGYLSSDQSLTSAEQPSLLSVASSDSSKGNNTSSNSESDYLSVASDGEEVKVSSESHSIVRQVQELLFGAQELRSSPEVDAPEPPVFENVSTPRSAQRDATPTSEKSTLPFKAYVPVIAEQFSEDDEENQRGSRASRAGKCRLLLLVLLFLAIVALVLTLVLSMTNIVNHTSKSMLPGQAVSTFAPTVKITFKAAPTKAPTPLAVWTPPPQAAPTFSPEQQTNSRASAAPSPAIDKVSHITQAPVSGQGAIPTLAPVHEPTTAPSKLRAPAFIPGQEHLTASPDAGTTAGGSHVPAVNSSLNPAASPSSVTTTFPQATPIGTPAPTVASTPKATASPEQNPTLLPTSNIGSVPSQAPVIAMTSETPTVLPISVRAPDPSPTASVPFSLQNISNNTIDSPDSPQHKAYQWLLNDDPANLTLDEIPVKTLEQRYIAALIYFSTNGEMWYSSCNFLTAADVCQWHEKLTGNGLSCDTQGTIQAIGINQNNLRGQLPSELQTLTGLKTLELRSNLISGSVPTEFGLLTNLEQLDLRQNQITGSFPSSIFGLPKLQNIFMLRNGKLHGKFPTTIEQATNLQMISFEQCQLSGSLPDSLGSLSQLSFLTLLGNELTGTIPQGLNQLPLLEVLELAGNRFSGTIPEFADQPGLYFISLYQNNFTGNIPVSAGALTGLLFFDIHENNLSGGIPDSFNSIPQLVTFYAAGNNLTGTIPTFSGNVGMLQSVDLSRNKLSGGIGDFLSRNGPVGELHTIDLSFNSLSGSVPTTIGAFSRLASLDLSVNELTGTLPLEIGKLTQMDTLQLKQNKLIGTIPEEVGLMKKLQYLDLSSNHLNGTITDTLGVLLELSQLDLSNNNFSGTLPKALDHLTNLDDLYLQNTSIEGNLDPILCNAQQGFKVFGNLVADCGGPNPAVTCSCCTACCNNATGCAFTS